VVHATIVKIMSAGLRKHDQDLFHRSYTAMDEGNFSGAGAYSLIEATACQRGSGMSPMTMGKETKKTAKNARSGRRISGVAIAVLCSGRPDMAVRRRSALAARFDPSKMPSAERATWRSSSWRPARFSAVLKSRSSQSRGHREEACSGLR